MVDLKNICNKQNLFRFVMLSFCLYFLNNGNILLGLTAKDLYYSFDKQESFNFLKSFIRPGDLVFDIGANEGNKTEIYILCEAKVVCIEPQPECVNVLNNKFCNNRNIIIENIGLGAKEGYLDLFQCSNAKTISTFNVEYTHKSRFAERNFRWDKKITVPISTLDKMILKYGKPRFCKIDVENFEYEVLTGLSQPLDYLSFEHNHECLEQTKKCLKYLAGLGYKEFNFAIGERNQFIFQTWLSENQFLNELDKLALSRDWGSIWGLWGDVYAKYEANK